MKTKKLLLILLIVLPVYILISLYYLDKQYFVYPIDYNKDLIIRSDKWGEGFFGARRSGGKRQHNGLDLLAEIGTPVLAARSGIVKDATRSRGMGNYVVLSHGENITTIYGHLSKIHVNKNELVRQGQIIGEVGKTGNANHREILPHLHFEIRVDNSPRDPLNYLE
ncbi:MAG: hypothetical protein DRP74_03430 [Candidatus Omnitrophota bacterium]|nr:MAG: hypothetical protein DRP74_03430 [Candidatus Omnitrophota bacterium]